MPDFAIVDAHVHLCQPGRLGYAWMSGAPALERTVLPADYLRAAAPVEIERFVCVEVDVDRPQHLAEAAWFVEQAATEPRLAGMVASLPLERGAAVEPELEQVRQHAVLRAIRRLIQDESDPGFCLQPGFIAGLKLLPQHDLAFEICIRQHQMGSAIRLVRQCPEVRFVLDHIGKPAIKAGRLEPWRGQLTELAALPNVHCKVSGVITEADHGRWTFEQIEPYVAHALETFGFDRVMFGGDWHVLSLAARYPQWVEVVDRVVAGCSADEKRKLFRDNAVGFYRLHG